MPCSDDYQLVKLCGLYSESRKDNIREKGGMVLRGGVRERERERERERGPLDSVLWLGCNG